nr:immunoglobulin heavy chain junction region [Macaca mulatta]MOW86495.1 immunoglobulin heavy chain junction region [Macaca mulatta]MOW86515.1 immunoglobulin heavy chain junction region [Macaca mulatta]MOW86547.1 immunoglobulin heavy chain junction region [Macaca mulatta]MOW86593.1 immunoglobulin heavy chain junction region [Macaca mulatta]
CAHYEYTNYGPFDFW